MTPGINKSVVAALKLRLEEDGFVIVDGSSGLSLSLSDNEGTWIKALKDAGYEGDLNVGSTKAGGAWPYFIYDTDRHTLRQAARMAEIAESD